MIQRWNRLWKKHGRLLSRGMLGGALAVALSAGAAGAAGPAAQATTVPFYQMMYQAKTGVLSSAGVSDNGASSFSVMAGTTPSVSQLATGGYVAAFQDANGDLIIWGPGILINDGPMEAGTSPSITATDNDSWEVAYMFANLNGDFMYTLGPSDGSVVEWGQAAPGTSPAIAPLCCNGEGAYEAAYQGVNNDLYTAGTMYTGDRGLPMMAGTSPGIADLSSGQGYMVAFQASTGFLWTVGDPSEQQVGLAYNTNLGMMAGTSPSIASDPSENELTGGEYEIAFQANTGVLWSTGLYNQGSWDLTMAPGTSPSIATYPDF